MQFLDAPVFQNVGAGLKAIIPALDRGMTYLGIMLKCGGTTFDNTYINNIEMSANGKRILRITGAHLLSISKYYNETNTAEYLFIPFADQEARTIDGELLGGLDTSVLNKVTLSVEIDGTAVAPELEARILAAPPKTGRADQRIFRTFLDGDHAPASAATHQLQIPMGTSGGNLIKAVHFFHNTTISQIDVERDGVDMQKGGDVATIDYLQNRRKRTPQTDHEVFDPVVLNNQSDSLPTLRSKRDGNGNLVLAPWRFDVTTTGADTIKSYTEAYVSLESI